MKKLLQRGAAASLVLIAIASCGARTGLPVPSGEESQCVSLNATAELADLDVFTLMDSSGSMLFETAAGPTKWDSVRAALAAFLGDPDSQGIGAAITFFPVIDESIPALCENGDASCGGVAGACLKFAFCIPTDNLLPAVQCKTQQDCADAGYPNAGCYPIGFCEKDPSSSCVPDTDIDCSVASGPCLKAGLCENHYACSSSVYEEPAVAVGTLPDAAGAILAAVDQKQPDGATSTLPALSGAVDGAIAWTKEHPGHKAIVVLATDGVPTVCDPALHDDDLPAAIDHIAEAAAFGLAHGVQTFVIGVFNSDEEEQATPALNEIAASGGTKKAYFVSTSADVTEQFLAALNEVRVTAKSCEFAIPLVDGALPDLQKMTVSITPEGGQTVSPPRRPGADQCDEEGGYYFDTPLDGPTPPGRVILCPATCGLFGSSTNRVVKLQVSCD